MGTIITAVVLACVVGLVIRKMIQDKKSGKSLQCGCDCAQCGGCGSKK
ncbi:FeoB-associated Cys-rich membrane protein [Parablautia muri]|uniref:FeoB-associated Cys-rich membrane protein n=1 Tax=Parablautia muri TaxID=2320879 RepID=A0A9X5GTD1_9FIRM|nr:FeoB-associated Cys-rich membrane protein [Parablautia muri]NBJ94074.1 FeoB-associated Cys-rich membrane protein [Parablautia muri]